MRLGQVINAARLKAKLTLRDVEAVTEHAVSGAGLSRIERGNRYPNLRTLEALTAVMPLRVVVEGGKTTATVKKS